MITSNPNCLTISIREVIVSLLYQKFKSSTQTFFRQVPIKTIALMILMLISYSCKKEMSESENLDLVFSNLFNKYIENIKEGDKEGLAGLTSKKNIKDVADDLRAIAKNREALKSFYSKYFEGKSEEDIAAMTDLDLFKLYLPNISNYPMFNEFVDTTTLYLGHISKPDGQIYIASKLKMTSEDFITQPEKFTLTPVRKEGSEWKLDLFDLSLFRFSLISTKANYDLVRAKAKQAEMKREQEKLRKRED